jgi:cytochrome bd-type quinol oxidase subunit 2
MVLLVATAVAMASAAVLGSPDHAKLTYSEDSLFLVLTGWTLWLMCFLPTLIAVHGPRWTDTITEGQLAHLAAHLRVSLMFIMAVLSACITVTRGFLHAQLDMTLLSVCLPALYVCVYLVSNLALKVDPTLVVVCAVVSGGVALFLHSRMAADIGGQGSTLLVFFHCLSRLVSAILTAGVS